MNKSQARLKLGVVINFDYRACGLDTGAAFTINHPVIYQCWLSQESARKLLKELRKRLAYIDGRLDEAFRNVWC